MNIYKLEEAYDSYDSYGVVRQTSRTETLRSSTHLLSFVSLQTANALSSLRGDEQQRSTKQTTSDRQHQRDNIRAGWGV